MWKATFRAATGLPPEGTAEKQWSRSPNISSSPVLIPASRNRRRPLETYSPSRAHRKWGEGRSNTTGGQRIGTETRVVGSPRAGDKAGETGSSENTGFRQSTDTTSVLNPTWRRKNLSLRSRTKVQGC